jgi:hypothetical protein
VAQQTSGLSLAVVVTQPLKDVQRLLEIFKGTPQVIAPTEDNGSMTQDFCNASFVA